MYLTTNSHIKKYYHIYLKLTIFEKQSCQTQFSKLFKMQRKKHDSSELHALYKWSFKYPLKKKGKNFSFLPCLRQFKQINISKNFDLCGIHKSLLWKTTNCTLTWEDDCMILPLLANPKKTPWKELRRELGKEAMIKGNVPATQAALNNPTSQGSILSLTQIKTKLHKPQDTGIGFP